MVWVGSWGLSRNGPRVSLEALVFRLRDLLHLRDAETVGN